MDQKENNINKKITGDKKMVITLEQRQVYSEVLEVLRHMDKTYVDKIPKKLIMFFYDNCSLDYEFRMTKAIGEENLQEETLTILPDCCLTIMGVTALQQLKTPLRLTSRTWS